MCEIKERLQNLYFFIENILGGEGGEGQKPRMILYNIQYIIQYIFCNLPYWNPQTNPYGQDFFLPNTTSQETKTVVFISGPFVIVHHINLSHTLYCGSDFLL